MDAPVVEIAEDCGPFARMLGGLLQANLQADPAKAQLLDGATGMVGIEVTDTGEELLVHFTSGEVWITPGPSGVAELRLAGPADVVLALSTVPLRFGLPDLLTSSGRSLTGRWVSGGLKIHGLPKGAPLLRTVLALLNVL